MAFRSLICRSGSLKRCSSFRNPLAINAVRGFRSSAALFETMVVKVPPMGEAVTQGELVEWLKNPGDAVAVDEVICTLETDKVTVDIRSEGAGVLLKQLANQEDTVNTDQPIAEIELGATTSTTPSSAPAEVDKEEPETALVEAPEAPQPPAPALDDLKPLNPPLIHFRYGIREQETVSPAVVASESDSTQSTEAYVELPPLYGRLPPLTEEEALRVQLGGADP